MLDSDAPEVSVPLLGTNMDCIVVWDAGKVPGSIKSMREAVSESQGSLAPGSSVTLTGHLKDFMEGTTMVIFIVSSDSFFGNIMFPETQDNGDVITRSVQV